MKEGKKIAAWISIIIIFIILLGVSIVVPWILLKKQEAKILSYSQFEKQKILSAENFPLSPEQKMALLIKSEDKMPLENGEVYTKQEIAAGIGEELLNLPIYGTEDNRMPEIDETQIEAEPELYFYRFQDKAINNTDNLKSNIFWRWSYHGKDVQVSGIFDEQSSLNFEISMKFLMKDWQTQTPERYAEEWGTYLGLALKEVGISSVIEIQRKSEENKNYMVFYEMPDSGARVVFLMQTWEKGFSFSLTDVII